MGLLDEIKNQGKIWEIDKPLGWTSFQVVNKMRSVLKSTLGERLKVGHTGTLDPLAEGLLVICAGKATKKVEEYTGHEKKYVATFELGKITRSYDLETPIEKNSDTSHITIEKIRLTIPNFLGEIEQLPPMYSAVKHQGKRLFDLARKGEEVERKKRRVYIHQLQVISFDNPEICFEISCSKGTYIRTLGHDFGQRLKTGAYLKKLTRTEIGVHYKLSNAQTLTQWEKMIRAYDG